MTKTILLILFVDMKYCIYFLIKVRESDRSSEEEEDSGLSFITGEENKDVGASNK